MFYARVLEITLLYTIFVIGIYPLTGLTGLFHWDRERLLFLERILRLSAI